MRKLYGKLNKDGIFESAPGTLNIDGYIIINPLEVHYRRAGYKPVEESEGTGMATYTETEDKIIQSWNESSNEEYEDQITALEIAVCELYEMIEEVLNNDEDIL